MTICSVEGCDRPGAKRTRNGRVSQYSMCGGHRTRFYKHGDVQAENPIREQAAWGEGWINPQGYRRHSLTGHPTANRHGHVFDHRVVLYDAIGAGVHACHWCRVPVAWEVDQRDGGLEVDHLDGDKLNNDLSNLVPSCTGCNTSRRHAGNPIEWTAA
jgi:hypothetical protein